MRAIVRLARVCSVKCVLSNQKRDRLVNFLNEPQALGEALAGPVEVGEPFLFGLGGGGGGGGSSGGGVGVGVGVGGVGGVGAVLGDIPARSPRYVVIYLGAALSV